MQVQVLLSAGGAGNLENKGVPALFRCMGKAGGRGDIGKILLFVCHWFWIQYDAGEGQLIGGWMRARSAG